MNFKNLLTLLSVFIISGCSMLKNNANFFSDANLTAPDSSVLKTNDPSLSAISNKSSDLLKETIDLVDKYIQSTEGQPECRSFVNQTLNMDTSQQVEYYKSLRSEQKSKVNSSIANNSFMNKLNVSSDLLKQAYTLKDEIAPGLKKNLLSSLTQFNKENPLLKISKQISYSIDKLKFLSGQYKIAQQIKQIK